MPETAVIEPLGAEALGGAAKAMLDGYDAGTGHWRFPRVGSFWQVIDEAHRRGHFGAGRRVAVIDGDFDWRIPALAAAAGRPPAAATDPSDPATVHGTVVALLILTVAPAVALDLHATAGPVGMDPPKVIAALAAIAASDADIACLSLGVKVAPTLRAAPSPDRQSPLFAGCRLPATCLCRAADGLVRPGRAVVAAIGNAEGSSYCPAIAPGVTGIGFLLDRRVVTGGAEAAWFEPPSFSQSADAAFNVMQPAEVVGSSFAAPLVAAALALDLDIAELPAMLAAVPLGGDADSYLAVAQQGDGAPDPQFDALVVAQYDAALAQFPHAALALDGEHWCIGCALFGLNLFINGGLALLRSGDLDRAEAMLRTARRLSPADPHAAANLGRLLLTRALAAESGQADFAADLAAEALAHYDHAIAMRPDHRDYDDARAAAASLAT